jgi:hypothetical protein
VGDLQGQAGVLLHQEDGLPLPVELLYGLKDEVHQDRGQAHGGLVHEEDAGVLHQGPADGQHLLLASGKRAPLLVPPLVEAGEEGEDLLLPFLNHPAVLFQIGPDL